MSEPVQYLCVQCDERFEVVQADKPRCPKCLRVHGLRALDAAPVDAASSGRKWLWLGIVLAAAAAVFAVSRRPERAEPQEPGARTAVPDATLNSAAGADAALLEPTDAVAAWATRVAGSSASPRERAEAVVKAIRARAQAQAFAPWSMVEPREGQEPLRPDAVVQALQKDGARAALYPLEVVALSVAALRSLDVGAFVGAVYAYPGEAAPPDASGRIGYYALVVRDAKGEAWLDPYAGRNGEPGASARRVLDDAQAVGALLTLRALHGQAKGEQSAALKLTERALSLWPDSPSARAVRATVLLSSGGVAEAERELEAALQLRDDPPQYNNIAMLRLAQGDVDTASKQVAKALERAPEYALARVTLASVYMVTMQRDLARVELEKAERLEPTMLGLALAWSQYHMMGGELEAAVARAKRAVETHPNNVQALILLGRIYREAGRYDEMRDSARKALAATSSQQRAQVRQLIEQVLGPTALMDGSGVGGTTAPGTVGVDPDHLELSKGSDLLAPNAPDGPALLDRPGDLSGSDDAPKLRLGADQLQLKLEP